jgi:two-component system, NarL family, response regulator LiaR
MTQKQNEKSNPIRVLVADDHDLLRMGLTVLLESYDDMMLVGEARNGQEAVNLCRALQPDVVLMDLLMPVMDGMTATALIRQEFPTTRVIALTSAFGESRKEDVLKAGASAYLTKDISTDTLVSVIREMVA